MTHLHWQKCERCGEGLGYGYPSLFCHDCRDTLGEEGVKLWHENYFLKQEVEDLKRQVTGLRALFNLSSLSAAYNKQEGGP